MVKISALGLTGTVGTVTQYGSDIKDASERILKLNDKYGCEQKGSVTVAIVGAVVSECSAEGKTLSAAVANLNKIAVDKPVDKPVDNKLKIEKEVSNG